MRIFISIDMEGVSGVERLEEVFRGGPGYETFRRVMAGDVNAAIQGAVDGGATDIVVADSHGYMCNIRPTDVHVSAKLRSGMQRSLCQFKGFDTRFDAVFLIGLHAKAGTTDGIMAHTWIPAFKDVRVNGLSVGEGGLNSYMAGYYGVPVILVVGDDKAVRQTQEVLERDVECVEVKHSRGPNTGIHLPIRESHARIREAARRAVKSNTGFTNVKTTRATLPVRLELDLAANTENSISRMLDENDRFRDSGTDTRMSDAELIASLHDVEVCGPGTVAWTCTDYSQAYTSLYRAMLHFYERDIEWLIEEESRPESYSRDLSDLLGDSPLNYL